MRRGVLHGVWFPGDEEGDTDPGFTNPTRLL